MNRLNNIFIDGSVNTGDISDDLSDEAIRNKIFEYPKSIAPNVDNKKIPK
jgi:hypothetical protein